VAIATKTKEGRTVDVVDTNIDWSFVGTSQEPVDGQVDRDLGMSLAEAIERRIQGWSESTGATAKFPCLSKNKVAS
jgi:hypothetical protein